MILAISAGVILIALLAIAVRFRFWESGKKTAICFACEMLIFALGIWIYAAIRR